VAASAGIDRPPIQFRPAWRTSLLLAGWQPAFGSLAAMAAGLALTVAVQAGSGFELSLASRVVETVIPLALGLQAAGLLSPETEPALELLLSYPRPLAWALLERLAAVFAVESAIAVAGCLVALAYSGGDFLLALLRWVAPSIFLIGVAAFGTLMLRQGAYGTLLATLMWGGMLFGGDPLLTRFPFLWPLHVYLQPGATTVPIYLANRLTLTLLGLAFIAMAAWLTRDEERLLSSPTRK
jgi:hypothetical protein